MRTTPMRRDSEAANAGAVHADACPDTTKAARRWGHTARNQRFWREIGPPAFRAFYDYLRKVDDPWQVAADVVAYAKRRTLERLTDADLLARYRELVVADKEHEARDTICDMSPAAGWLEVARSHRIDAAINSELSAVAALLQERRVKREAAFHA